MLRLRQGRDRQQVGGSFSSDSGKQQLMMVPQHAIVIHRNNAMEIDDDHFDLSVQGAISA